MIQWRVVVLAALAVLLQLVGLLALTLPESYEGPVLYVFDEQHAVFALDGVGVLLLGLGCIVAWGAGALWHRRMYAS
jgi:hypothetical protein